MIRYRQFCYGRSNRLVRLPGARSSLLQQFPASSPKKRAFELILLQREALLQRRRATIGVAWLVIGIVTALNAILILLTVLGP